MIGTVLNYNSGERSYDPPAERYGGMTVDVISIEGTGTADSWIVNLDGAVGAIGETGPMGPVGATGPIGPSGINNLVFATDGSTRTLTGYSQNGVTTSVRTAAITGGRLVLNLAEFNPTVTASDYFLNWDEPATYFTVDVVNPDDITDKYIVHPLYILKGNDAPVDLDSLDPANTTYISNWTASAYTSFPAPGVDWSRTFSPLAPTSNLRFPGPTNSGTGSAVLSVSIYFSYLDGEQYLRWPTSAVAYIRWRAPQHSISIASLTGKTFLQKYTSTTYTPSITGVSNSSNYNFVVMGINGNVTNSSGAGTLNFTTVIHKDNASSTSTYVSLSTQLSRPVGVTGTAYNEQLTSADSTNVNSTASFSYPSFWLWTTGTGVVPLGPDIVSDAGTGGFKAGVTQLGNQVKVLSTQAINNTDSNPRAFWFAVRASVSQPTSFKTGASAGLLSDVAVVNGGILPLQPETPPSGYVAEYYRLWGITLQPGITYVSIS
jgi:hypothetical protein